MKKIIVCFCFMIAAISMNFVGAEESRSSASASSPQVKALEMFEVFVYPGNPIYTKDMAAQGIQGSTIVSLNMDATNIITSAELPEKSRDETIDALALAFFNRPKLRMGFKDGDKYRHDRVKITFTKDEFLQFKYKTCGDAIIDGNYFKKIYPEKDVGDMRFWESTSGLMFIISIDKSKKPLNTNKTLELVVEECKLHPEKNVFETYRALAQFD